jgi:predicted thioredoxin/glutaredoxin
LRAFIETLLSSSYASSIALLHGDLAYAAFKELVEASLRAPFTGLDAAEVG